MSLPRWRTRAKAISACLRPLRAWCLIGAALLGSTAWAQERWLLVSPFPPGGPVDTLSRILAEGLQKKTGLPALVENLPGAAGNLGIDKVRRARPDGRTLLVVPAGNLTINPTLTIYEASRDANAQRFAPWHADYTMPALTEFFKPSRYAHGSYWFDWTTEHEVAWRKNYQLWFAFLNDYKNHGGRVTTGSDAGYIYKIYGFAYIQELELLREAGFNPLEVIQAATLNGAEALGMAEQIGSLVPGKKADMVIVAENPLANFKVLYGTGHYQLNSQNQPEQTKGVRYTIKDGIVYDAQQLLAEVRQMVHQAKAAGPTTQSASQ